MEAPDNKATRQESIQAFDAEQEARFLEAILRTEPRFYPFFLLLARTALRSWTRPRAAMAVP